jgi:hypothetical protein
LSTACTVTSMAPKYGSVNAVNPITVFVAAEPARSGINGRRKKQRKDEDEQPWREYPSALSGRWYLASYSSSSTEGGSLTSELLGGQYDVTRGEVSECYHRSEVNLSCHLRRRQLRGFRGVKRHEVAEVAWA